MYKGVPMLDAEKQDGEGAVQDQGVQKQVASEQRVVQHTESSEGASSQPSEETSEGSVHPLEPEGDRFKQVYARGKRAEERANLLEAELAQERETRIRLEERERIHQEQRSKDPAQKPLEWSQLNPLIEQGQVTWAEAVAYREKALRDQIREESTRAVQSTLAEAAKTATVQAQLGRYVKALPQALNPQSEERAKLARNFNELVTVYGQPRNEATELLAAKMTFGDIDTVEKSQQFSRSRTSETFMDTGTGSAQGSDASNTDKVGAFAANLAKKDPRRYEYYKRRMERGSYPGGWKDVQKELTWKAPRL